MRLLGIALLGCFMLTRPAVAQSERPWGFTSFYTYEALDGRRPAWHLLHLGVQHYFSPQLTLMAEVAMHQRFNRRDAALALEGWATLWYGAYGNVRLQYVPHARFLPRVEGYVELYQGIGAWELAISFRPRFFTGETVPTLGLAMARYEGNWYLRTRMLLTALAGHVNWTQSFRARYYWNPPLAYVDLQFGYGRGVEIVDVGPVLRAVRTYFAAVRLQRFITRTVGLSIGFSYSDDDLFIRRGISMGLFQRW
ncbi:MAG: YaiO family outer membrane beta-barrel protein [Rhodothermus sp.]|nr:YaiO family outer membrane beta-barrel protein [Rhodothermus sp.]